MLITRRIGVGLTLEEADALANTIKRIDVLAYVGTVHVAAATWLVSLEDAELGGRPDGLAL
jgi:hypothetical protein